MPGLFANSFTIKNSVVVSFSGRNFPFHSHSSCEASRTSFPCLIIFLDSDIYVKEDWIFKMLSVIQNKNIIGVTGSLGPFPNKRLTLLEKYLFSKYRGHQVKNLNTPLDYKSFVFSNTIIKKAALDQTGFFNENLKHYGGEDTELAIRLNKLYPTQMRKCHAYSIHDAGKTLKK